MKTFSHVLLINILLVILLSRVYTQVNTNTNQNNSYRDSYFNPGITYRQDTTKNENKKTRKVTISGIFVSAGTGLSLPIAQFNATSNPVFGIFGRVEYSSTSIFPVVIGGEFAYFSYPGADQYKTLNLLTNFRTKDFSIGLTADISLSQLFKSNYTIPFICIDVKTNKISRDISGQPLPIVPVKETRTSIGAGFGFTLFVLDFYVKYNYMKTLSSFGIYTKIKFPVLRF